MAESNLKSHRATLIIFITLGLALWGLAIKSCEEQHRKAERAAIIQGLLSECRVNQMQFEVLIADGQAEGVEIPVRVKELNIFIENESSFTFSKNTSFRWKGIKRQFKEKGLVMAGIVDAKLNPGNAMEMSYIYRELFDMLLTAIQNGYDFNYGESVSAVKIRGQEESADR